MDDTIIKSKDNLEGFFLEPFHSPRDLSLRWYKCNLTTTAQDFKSSDQIHMSNNFILKLYISFIAAIKNDYNTIYNVNSFNPDNR